MKRRGAKLYLSDILESIKKIKRYVEKLSFEEFINDQKTIDAVIRNFEIIGEATKNVPREIKLKFPQLPWKKMAGMRDRIVHEYFGVDLEIIWETIKEDLSQIKPLIKKILESLRNET